MALAGSCAVNSMNCPVAAELHTFLPGRFGLDQVGIIFRPQNRARVGHVFRFVSGPGNVCTSKGLGGTQRNAQEYHDRKQVHRLNKQ